MAALGWLLNLDFAGGGVAVGPTKIILVVAAAGSVTPSAVSALTREQPASIVGSSRPAAVETPQRGSTAVDAGSTRPGPVEAQGG